MEADVLRFNGQRESGWQRAVPCKLNNVKMTFITLDKYKVCLRFKNSQRKFLSKFARQIDQNTMILELRL